jgi:hypothetical protein
MKQQNCVEGIPRESATGAFGISGKSEDEDGDRPPSLVRARQRLAPAEAFLDALAQPLADRIAELDPARLQLFDEGLVAVAMRSSR